MQSYIARTFRDRLGEAQAAMEALVADPPWKPGRIRRLDWLPGGI
jgi:hypothetical protein